MRFVKFCLRIFWGVCLLAAAAWSDGAPQEREEEAQRDGAIPLRRPSLFELEPRNPLILPPPKPDATERERLKRIEEADEDFTAPPLVVARISTLPVEMGDSATQALYRAERNLIRERARAADRMFRQGNADEAMAIMKDTERLLQTTALRIMALNRLAAYHFRLNQFEESAAYARKAWELDMSDPVSASNLAAILLSAERVDEALDILLRAYGKAFDRPQIAFAIHFNLACAYSMKGEETPAIQNLALAVQIDPYATLAALGDPHLDSIRQTREFARIREALERLPHAVDPLRAP
jgi:tetratricopeptide (TPR) repeat protein